MKKLVCFALILLSLNLYADEKEAFMSFGLGVRNSADYYPDQVKLMNVGFRNYFWPGLYWGLKAGFWTDQSPESGRSGTAYVAGSLGMKVNVHPLVIRGGWGLAAISNPDSYLGGRLPLFNGELYAGFEDKYGNAMGIQYEHISSAGILSPNRGRDFLMLQFSLKWPMFIEQ